MSPDTIVPNPTNPQSFNRYSYVENNPINFSDPTGHCGADIANTPNVQPGAMDPGMYADCVSIRDGLEGQFGVNITGIWKLVEMQALQAAFADIEAGIGLNNAEATYRGTVIQRLRESGQSAVEIPLNTVKVRNGTFAQGAGSLAAQFVLIHELMHRLDAKHGLAISAMYEELTGGRTVITGTSTGCPAELGTLSGTCSYDQGPDPVSRYSGDNRREDWADSAAASFFDGGNVTSILNGQTNHGIYGPLSVDRGQAVQDSLNYSFDLLFPVSGGGKTSNIATE